MQGTQHEYNILHELVAMSRTCLDFQEEQGYVDERDEQTYMEGRALLLSFTVIKPEPDSTPDSAT